MIYRGGRNLLLGSLIVGALGLIIMVIGFVADRREAMFSWLIVWNLLTSTVLGALVLLMTCHAMSAKWPTALRRLLDATIAVMPLLAVAFIPLFFGLGDLYPFMHPERVTPAEVRHYLEHKRAWLNAPLFIGRGVGFLVVWVVVCEIMRARSLRLDTPGHAIEKGALKTLSCALLPLVAFTLTFASFDWVMALSPDWYSTMFGVYYFSGGFVAAVALWIVLVGVARRRGAFLELRRSHFYALGRLLLGFIIFWAYIAYFQFFLIWIANKPIEARWFLDRVRGGFRAESWVLGIGHFGVPFFILLLYSVKQRLSTLVPIAVWVLAMHAVDVHWLIAPARGHVWSWFDLAALAALGGLSLAFAVFRQRGRSLIPAGDPDYEPALAYESI